MAMKKNNLPEVVPEVFEHEEFGQFRYIKRGEEIWFVANDVCRVLGYSNPRKALADHVDDDEKGVTKCDTLGGVQTLAIINESGLYSLIFSSTLPAAKKFKRWVTHEVLPSIRKYGYYHMNTEKKMTLYVGKVAPEFLGPKMTSDEFFEVIDKLLANQVEFRPVKPEHALREP